MRTLQQFYRRVTVTLERYFVYRLLWGNRVNVAIIGFLFCLLRNADFPAWSAEGRTAFIALCWFMVGFYLNEILHWKD